jgi:hypothetical protein
MADASSLFKKKKGKKTSVNLNTASLPITQQRIITRKGYIVAYRALITGGRTQLEDKQSIHVADVTKISKEYLAPPSSTAPRDVESSGPPLPSIAAGPEKAGLGEFSPLAGVGVESEEVPTLAVPEQPGTRRSSRHLV